MVTLVTIMTARAQALELENFLPYRLSILSQTVSEALHGLYASPYGLSVPQWRVMAVLGRFAPMAAADICQRTVMDKVAVSRAVADLRSRGLVAAAVDRRDARRTALTLSPAGRAMHRRIVPIALEFERSVASALSSEERAVFVALCERLQARAEAVSAS